MTPHPNPRKKREKINTPKLFEAVWIAAPTTVIAKESIRAVFRPNLLEKGATKRNPMILPAGSIALMAPRVAFSG